MKKILMVFLVIAIAPMARPMGDVRPELMEEVVVSYAAANGLVPSDAEVQEYLIWESRGDARAMRHWTTQLMTSVDDFQELGEMNELANEGRKERGLLMVTMWKVYQHLHANFGGRVVETAFSPFTMWDEVVVPPTYQLPQPIDALADLAGEDEALLDYLQQLADSGQFAGQMPFAMPPWSASISYMPPIEAR